MDINMDMKSNIVTLSRISIGFNFACFLCFTLVAESYSFDQVIKGQRESVRTSDGNFVSNFKKDLYGTFMKSVPNFTAKQLSDFNHIAIENAKQVQHITEILEKIGEKVHVMLTWKQNDKGLERLVDEVFKTLIGSRGKEQPKTIRSVNDFFEELFDQYMHTTPNFTTVQLFLFTRKTHDIVKQYKDALHLHIKVEEHMVPLQYLFDKYQSLKKPLKPLTPNAIGLSDEMFATCTRDCGFKKEKKTGVYTMFQNTSKLFHVMCDMETDGGNWTVIQRRQDGSVSFRKSWKQYREGFGKLTKEFWLGNDKIHRITSCARHELRVDIEDWEGNSWYAVYNTFQIGDEASKYKLTVSGYSGTAGDSLTYHNAMSFSTRDQDNDKISGICTNTYGGGGWWFNDCLRSNLNGLYRRGSGSKGVTWNKVKNRPYSMKFSRMMIRRV